MTENREHPGQDEELTGRYALGRLSQPERKDYEEHLRLCPECRRMAEEEVRLAAGIRAAGRGELRLRLRRRLGDESAGRTLPWTRIVAIAASLVLIIGVGIVQHWLSDGRAAKEIPVVAESRESREPIGKGENAPSPPLARSEVPGEAGKTPARTEGKSLGSALPDREAHYATDAPDALAGGGAKTRDEVILLQGEILTDEEEAGTARAQDAIRPEAEMNQLAKEKGAVEPLPSARLQSAQNVQLLQRSRAEVPPSAGRGKSTTRQMEAGLQKVDAQLLLTLYPDTPFTQAAIDRGRADWLSPDTLRVRIGGQTIIYRLPPSLQQNVPVR